MKALFAAAIAAAFFVPVSIGWADGPAVTPGVVGVLSPNGTFKPLTNSVLQSSTQTSKFYSGIIGTTINIAVATPLSVNAIVQCTVTASVTGTSAAGLTDVVIESDTVIATGNSSVMSCQPVIPYKWGLFANTGTPIIKDSVTMTYNVTAIAPPSANRSTTSTFDVMSVPANNATTTFTVSARI